MKISILDVYITFFLIPIWLVPLIIPLLFLAGIPKFILISVHDYNLPSFLLSSGYFTGKRKAESQVLSKYPSSGNGWLNFIVLILYCKPCVKTNRSICIGIWCSVAWEEKITTTEKEKCSFFKCWHACLHASYSLIECESIYWIGGRMH